MKFYRTWLITLLLSSGLQTLSGQDAGIEARLRKAGLTDISSVDPSIKVRLAYSTADNFVGADMYGDLEKAYFQPEIARMLASAQAELRRIRPGYSLLILDAARPMSVQARMFRLVAGTPLNVYVANPAKGGGRHNYGVAADVTIVDGNGAQLDMGSPFDHFGQTSHTGQEASLVARGLISEQAAKNRALLTKVMTGAGFAQHPKEWWHFHKYGMEELKIKYKPLNF